MKTRGKVGHKLRPSNHWWSFFGKVGGNGGAKIILDNGFCANMAKISRFIVEQSSNLIL